MFTAPLFENRKSNNTITIRKTFFFLSEQTWIIRILLENQIIRNTFLENYSKTKFLLPLYFIHLLVNTIIQSNPYKTVVIGEIFYTIDVGGTHSVLNRNYFQYNDFGHPIKHFTKLNPVRLSIFNDIITSQFVFCSRTIVGKTRKRKISSADSRSINERRTCWTLLFKRKNIKTFYAKT